MTFRSALNETTRTYFERMAAVETGPEAADMRAVAKDPPDLAAASRLAAGSPYFNAIHANHLRGHADRGRTRQQRAAADGVGSHQLPYLPRRLGRVCFTTIWRRPWADPGIAVTTLAAARPAPASALLPESDGSG